MCWISLMRLEGCTVEKWGQRGTFPHAFSGTRGAHWNWPRCSHDLTEVGLAQQDIRGG
jgi:hypothetical protein